MFAANFPQPVPLPILGDEVEDVGPAVPTAYVRWRQISREVMFLSLQRRLWMRVRSRSSIESCMRCRHPSPDIFDLLSDA